MLITVTLSAGQLQEYSEENDFFRVLEATGLITLTFYFNGKEVSRAEKVKEGYAEKFLTERYNKVVIKNESASSQTIQFVGRLGHEVEYNKTPQGDVKVNGIINTGQLKSTVFNLPAVNNVGVVPPPPPRISEISNAKTRKYFCLKNKGVGNIVVLLNDTLTDSVGGFVVGTGESLNFNEFCPSSKVRIFGDMPASIELIEGE